MLSLYQIKQQILEVLELLEDGGEFQTCTDTLDALNLSLDEKLIGCCAWYKNLCARSEVFMHEAVRLKERADAIGRQADAFKAYIARCIGEGNKWSSGVHEIGWRKSTSVKLDEVAEMNPTDYVPAAYLKEKLSYEPDKKLIKQDLESGATIPHCTLQKKMNIQIK